jgi:peptidyl-prolyl cis-trans isomerase SurA
LRSKLTIFAWTICVAISMTLTTGVAALAQEGEPVVIDSVIAQVNSDVIMLSTLKREMKDAIDSFVQNGMSKDKAEAEVTRRQPELIANLVDELLLVQKGKELNMTNEVEDQVNSEMLRVMKEQGFKTIADMEAAMRKEGIDPVAIRQTIRTQYMKGAVLGREVDQKIYNGITTKEAQEYYNAHRDLFRKPEVVKFSEIFLSLAGKPEADVRAKAAQLVTQLRAGADFKTLAAANSDRLDQNGERAAPKNGGLVGTFAVTDLKPEFVNALKNVPVGGVSDPLRLDEGLEILRVEERTPASEPIAFNEEKVREAMTFERRDKQREAYMKTLRKEAYIRLADDYRATVGPLLATDTPSTKANTSAPAPAPKNSNGKKP